jgi:protoporphyrinogen oxidase
MKKETLYIVGAGLLGLTIGYFLYKPKTTEETTSSFAGSTKVPCLTKDQFACLTSDVNKRKLVAILKECGLSAEQISLYLKSNKKMLSSRICK